MVLNRSEETGSHCIVIPLGIELPVRTSEILSLLPAWVGGAAIWTTLKLI